MKFSELSKPDQAIIAMMSELHYGRLEYLDIKDGSAVVTAASRRISTENFDTDDTKHVSGRTDGDFILNKKQERFLQRIHTTKQGLIQSVVVNAGLPIKAEITEYAVAQ